MKQHDKLVRDKIPEVLETEGVQFTSRTVTGDELRSAVVRKLVEESQELAEANTRQEALEERVDVEEVLWAIDTAYKFTPEEIAAARAKKFEDRGGFEQGIFLETTD